LDFLTFEDGTNILSQNVSKGLPLDAAQHPRRAQILSTLQRKPETKFISVMQKAHQGIAKPFGMELLLCSIFLHFFVNVSPAEVLQINISKFPVCFIRSSVPMHLLFLSTHPFF
jgi:hypothetical protein